MGGIKDEKDAADEYGHRLLFGKSRTMSLLIQIDKDSGTSLVQQIIGRIRELADCGAVKPGTRLPSTRAMAEQLGINRSTVYKAYQELWSLGYLESRPGSYSVLRKRTRVATERDSSLPSSIGWSARISGLVNELCGAHREEAAIMREEKSGDLIDFVPLSPDSCIFPIDDFRRCMNEALIDAGAGVLQYGDPQGYFPLREFIAGRMREHSIAISPDEILVTTGAQAGIALLATLLVRPQNIVCVEAPTYSRAVEVLQLHGAKITQIPMTEDGMDLDVLENILSSEQPVAMIYTMPNFHNPTGITTRQKHRERLLGLCERHAVPLIEDGYEEEMKYGGKVVLPIKSMDRSGTVVYVGTFSKVLFPGLRIGWIAAGRELVDCLVPVQRASILCGSLLDQAALARFCQCGCYERHLRRMHRLYRKRMAAALAAMEKHWCPTVCEWTRPVGGYALWVKVKSGASEAEVIRRLRKHGAAVSPGRFHFSEPPAQVYFRISIAHLDESGIEAGIRRIGRALETLAK